MAGIAALCVPVRQTLIKVKYMPQLYLFLSDYLVAKGCGCFERFKIGLSLCKEFLSVTL